MIEVLKPGFYSSIQDLGRFEGLEYGIPISGAMDKLASNKANMCLGNQSSDAVLEITMTGPELMFQSKTAIAVSGAPIQLKLNGRNIEMDVAYSINTGDTLHIGRVESGFRSYLAVLGGFQTEKVLKSRSMYYGITQAYKINKGDILPFRSETTLSAVSGDIKNNRASHFNQSELVVFPGPEYQKLADTNKETLVSKTFLVSKNNNRMAYQLDEKIPNQLEPILTGPVMPGTVQLTPSGSIIILMRDCQTTGGYPRILQLSEESISKLSQKFTGSKVRFTLETSQNS